MMKHDDTTMWFTQAFTGFAMFFLGSAHLLMMMVQADTIGPYGSSTRMYSDVMWPFYLLLLLAVEFHGGIGLYRLCVKWGWFEGVDAKESRKSRLASTLVLGAEYGFFNNKLAVGVLSTTRFVQPDALTELTFSANYRPKSWFNVALSYSAIQSAGKSFGLGLKLGPLFVGTDYMFLGKNSNSVNGFVGVSIPLGGRKASKEG